MNTVEYKRVKGKRYRKVITPYVTRNGKRVYAAKEGNPKITVYVFWVLDPE